MIGTALVGMALLTLVLTTGFFANASHANRNHAVQWHKRATELEHLLVARTTQLNERTAALGKSADEIATLNRQVSSLEGRMRTLANEKAQVEDQRGALAAETATLKQIATEQGTCSDGLSGLLAAFADQDYVYVETNAATVGDACRQARADFSSFQAQIAG
jgi:hypothetical protein